MRGDAPDAKGIHFRFGDGMTGDTAFMQRCTRGPIERELRACTARGDEPFSHRDLSEEALRGVLYASADRARRGASDPHYEVGGWIDAMSEAIEGAAELGI